MTLLEALPHSAPAYMPAFIEAEQSHFEVYSRKMAARYNSTCGEVRRFEVAVVSVDKLRKRIALYVRRGDITSFSFSRSRYQS